LHRHALIVANRPMLDDEPILDSLKVCLSHGERLAGRHNTRSTLETSRATRLRIMDSAQTSFVERGFGATTTRQIADDAEVSQETIYKTFGGKAALVKAVYDVSLAGDDDPTPLAGRPEAIAVRDAQNPAEAAATYAQLAQLISSRIDPLLRVLVGSRDTDKALSEFARTTDKERHIGSTFFVQQSATKGWLRDDITFEHAIDTVCASTHRSPAGSFSITAGVKSSTPVGSAP
jgi:AcrR family transcriptional regulator